MAGAHESGGSGAAGGTVVYAVGDVHGRSDLLGALYGLIARDAASRAATRKVLVLLGDYVDRGADSNGVIALAMRGIDGFDTVALRGNHEQLMLDWIESADETAGAVWIANGGDVAARSILGEDYIGLPDPARLKAAFGPEALSWLKNLPCSHREGGFLFVHAGINPARTLDRQRKEDMLWIRGKFLDDRRDFGVRVVHGHTPTRDGRPEVLANRINLDTGAVWSGRLTAAVLDPDAPSAPLDFLYAEGARRTLWG